MLLRIIFFKNLTIRQSLRGHWLKFSGRNNKDENSSSNKFLNSANGSENFRKYGKGWRTHWQKRKDRNQVRILV